MAVIARVIALLLISAAFLSCSLAPDGGYRPPPLVMLWDEPASERKPDERGELPRLALFHPDGRHDEFDFAPLWSEDVFVSVKSGVAAFVGGSDSASLDETLQCYDIVTGERLFEIEGKWIPLGFIEDGWSLVALRVETKWRLAHEGDPDRGRGNFTKLGYSLQYTAHIIDVLSGGMEDGTVIYDAHTRRIRWEDRYNFKPALAIDAGMLFAALPEFPYRSQELADDSRPVKLWALDLRTNESRCMDIGDYIRHLDFSFMVSCDGKSILFQSQAANETKTLRMPNYGNAMRRWGDLYLWSDGAAVKIAEQDESHVRHQVGITHRGGSLLYAEIEVNPETRQAISGTLGFCIQDCSGRDREVLPLHGDIRSVSFSPGGRWVGYMKAVDNHLEARLLDIISMKDDLLGECGEYTRFYGFAGAGRGDIAIPQLDAMLFGFQNPMATF
jgi:hypothetical protein